MLVISSALFINNFHIGLTENCVLLLEYEIDVLFNCNLYRKYISTEARRMKKIIINMQITNYRDI